MAIVYCKDIYVLSVTASVVVTYNEGNGGGDGSHAHSVESDCELYSQVTVRLVSTHHSMTSTHAMLVVVTKCAVIDLLDAWRWR